MRAVAGGHPASAVTPGVLRSHWQDLSNWGPSASASRHTVPGPTPDGHRNMTEPPPKPVPVHNRSGDMPRQVRGTSQPRSRPRQAQWRHSIHRMVRAQSRHRRPRQRKAVLRQSRRQQGISSFHPPGVSSQVADGARPRSRSCTGLVRTSSSLRRLPRGQSEARDGVVRRRRRRWKPRVWRRLRFSHGASFGDEQWIGCWCPRGARRVICRCAYQTQILVRYAGIGDGYSRLRSCGRHRR
jgi:hypothetical protein